MSVCDCNLDSKNCTTPVVSGKCSTCNDNSHKVCMSCDKHLLITNPSSCEDNKLLTLMYNNNKPKKYLCKDCLNHVKTLCTDNNNNQSRQYRDQFGRIHNTTHTNGHDFIKIMLPNGRVGLVQVNEKYLKYKKKYLELKQLAIQQGKL